ncbi:MAG: cytochrome c [Colwellia sp.]|jgi:Cytochrome c, mono- and diheme variants
MSPLKISLVGFALATHLLSISSAAANEEALSQERKNQLAHIVKQDCGSCHGMTLKGGLGPALLPENLEGKPILFLQHTILYGRTGTAMPPWNPLLTEQEALWISQQLKAGKITKPSTQ